MMYFNLSVVTSRRNIFFFLNYAENSTITTKHNKNNNQSWYNCVYKNPSWYSADVREGGLQSLLEFLVTCQAAIRENIKSNHDKTWTNLTTSQLNAFRRVVVDDSIVIKMADERLLLLLIKKIIFRLVKKF